MTLIKYTIPSVLLFTIMLKTIFCDNTTILLTLHGRGESMNDGNAHSFVVKLQQMLKNKSLDNSYKVMNVGLSDDSDEDYDWSSYTSMEFQSEKLCQYIQRPEKWDQLMKANRIVLIGFSQGGLLFRGLLWGQCLDELTPRVEKLITFGGPHSGVFGKPDCSQIDSKIKILIEACDLLQKIDDLSHLGPALYDIFMYTELAQNYFSAASFWNSPNNPKQRKTWLAMIDNQITYSDMSLDKYLNTKLKKGLVLISFGLEATVLPPISASFGYWDSSAKNWIPFNQTDIYNEDLIGLSELYDKNILHFYTIENESHMSIPDEFIENKFMNFVN